MGNRITTEGFSQCQIYENGDLYSISIDDLKGNKVAITQLVNDYNAKVRAIEKLQDSEKQLSSELQYQNANPFFSIIAAIINVVGSVISCCGVNFLTGEKKMFIGYLLISAGSVLLLSGSLLTICYRYVYGWMNKKYNH